MLLLRSQIPTREYGISAGARINSQMTKAFPSKVIDANSVLTCYNNKADFSLVHILTNIIENNSIKR